MTRPLNPPEIESKLLALSNDIARGVKIVSDAEKTYVDSQREFDRAKAKAQLEAQGTVAEREAQVELATASQRDQRDQDYLAFQHAKRTLRSLDQRIDALQSIGASVRQAYVVAGRGEK